MFRCLVTNYIESTRLIFSICYAPIRASFQPPKLSMSDHPQSSMTICHLFSIVWIMESLSTNMSKMDSNLFPHTSESITKTYIFQFTGFLIQLLFVGNAAIFTFYPHCNTPLARLPIDIPSHFSPSSVLPIIISLKFKLHCMPPE